MKKRLLIILLLLPFLLFSACLSKHKKLRLPERAEVTMVRLSTMEDEEWRLLVREKDVDQVFEDLWQIDYRPKGSYHDLPTADAWIKIEFKGPGFELTQYTVYLCEKNGELFIEQPYHGIFSVDEAMYQRFYDLLRK